MSKRLVAKRGLRTKCYCGRMIIRGQVYYKQRHVVAFEDKVCGVDEIWCARCEYERNRRIERLKRCPHKKTNAVYHYILGECVMEPDYERCMQCGKVVTE